MLLLPSDLTFLRAAQAKAMPDVCTLRTVTQSSDGSGGWTEGTSDAANVPCRLTYTGGNRLIEALQATTERDYILTIPTTYTVSPGMRVVKGGDTFNVVSVNDPASWQTAKRATLRRINP